MGAQRKAIEAYEAILNIEPDHQQAQSMLKKISNIELNQHVYDLIDIVGMTRQSLDRYPHEFSGGQRQRIALARAIILQPKLVILDEPTSALDRTVQAQIIDLLRQLQYQKNLAYLFISHDLKVIRAISHKVLVLQGGKVVEQGPATVSYTHLTLPTKA